jgi:calcineurin-like phosphoesterase family protein
MRSIVWPPEKFLVRGHRPSLPAGLRVYAIGDIHGRLDLLNQLLSLINADMAQFPAIRPVYVFLGDYIDRGHWSRETIGIPEGQP